MPDSLLGIQPTPSTRTAAPPSLIGRLPELARQPYWHPDQIKHKTAPEGLKHDQWWPLLKCFRIARRQPIALEEKQTIPFGLVVVDEMLPILHHFDSQGRSHGTASGTRQEVLQAHRTAVLMEEAIASTGLTGQVVSRETCREMLRAGRHPLHQSEQQVSNLYRQLKHLPDLADCPLTPESVARVHQKLQEHVGVDGNHRPAAAGIDWLCRFAEHPEGPFLHPLLRAVLVHFWVLYRRPFFQGNEITARFLMHWTALRHGYTALAHVAPSDFLLPRRDDYRQAVERVLSDEGDLTYFVLPVLHSLAEAFISAQKAIHDIEQEMAQGRAAWNRFGFLNPRQEDIVMRAMKKPGAVFTIEAHRESHDLAYATARADLLRLEQIGLMSKRQRGKGFVFETAPNWLEKLQRLSGDG